MDKIFGIVFEEKTHHVSELYKTDLHIAGGF